MYDSILVPTDGSEPAEAAMGHAIDLSEKYDADIHVLHVINARLYDTSIESQVAPLRRKGNEYLDRMTEIADEAGTSITTEMEIGRPARVILEYVDDQDISLVVMGTRGRGGLPRRLLGSVTNYVVTNATVPVHVVPPSEAEEAEFDPE